MPFIVGVATSYSGVLDANGFILFAILSAFVGFAGSMYLATLTAMFQEQIAPQYLGRVFSLYTSIASLAMPIGLMTSGIFTDHIGVANWFIVSGIIISLCGILIILSSKKYDVK